MPVCDGAIKDMAVKNEKYKIVEEEQGLLGSIRHTLAENPVVVGASDSDTLREMDRLRLELPNAKEEDKAALLRQYDRLSHVLNQLRKGRNNAEVDPDSPYFAHLRLQEGERVRDLYLGKATRIDNGLRIIDWRNAPVSRLFYRYREEDEYSEPMGGRVQDGKILARRTVGINSGELNRVSAPQGIFVKQSSGDWNREERHQPKLVEGFEEGPLHHAQADGQRRRLGGSAIDRGPDKHLPDIAALLDEEQFELITSVDSGLIAIRGGAGSGKTTVALHRAAWLAFRDRGRFSPHKMAIVVWGRALRDYISTVLPSLGVDGVKVSTWSRWSQDFVKRLYPFLPRNRADDTPEVVTRLKLHPGLIRILEQHVSERYAPPTAQGAFDDWAHIMTDPTALFSSMEKSHPGEFTLAQLKKAADWTRALNYRLNDWMEGDRSEPAELDVEDDAILLFLFQLRVGALRLRRKQFSLSHLVVDEVQDFAPIELKVLVGTLDKQTCATFAGDTQQQISQKSTFGSWDELFEQLGVEGMGVSTLKIGYRSTQRITSFARGILGELAEDETFTVAAKEGPRVELFSFTDHGACVAFLGDSLKDLSRSEPNASIAIITPEPSLTNLYFDGLQKSEVPNLRKVVDQKFAFEPGVEVVQIADIKGLEFDYVVLVDVNASHYPDDPHARRLMHVGATRAAHQLWLTSVGTPSPIIKGF